jgi:hypothetical protein
MGQTNTKNNVVAIDAVNILAHETNKTKIARFYGKDPATIKRWMRGGDWRPGDPAPPRRPQPKNPAPTDAGSTQNLESFQRVPTGTPVGAPSGVTTMESGIRRAIAGARSLVSAAYTLFVFIAMFICAAMNARYHWSLGETAGTMMGGSLAALGFVNDGLTFLLPKRAKAQWRNGDRGDALFKWTLWLCVFFPLTTLSTAGFTSQNFGDAMASRAGILVHASGTAD